MALPTNQTFWSAYAVIAASITLLFYDVLYKNWIDFPSHGILSLVAVFLVFMATLILGDTITGFILLVPAIAIVLYIILEASKAKPTLEAPPAPAPEQVGRCIDPAKIDGCKRLVQVLVSKEDSALARCKAKQTAPPSLAPQPPPEPRSVDVSKCVPAV